jgi:hypothetical protein
MSLYFTAIYYQTSRTVGLLLGCNERESDGSLNSRAGVFALSLATWHGMRIVSLLDPLLRSVIDDVDSPTHISPPNSRAFLHPSARCSEITSKPPPTLLGIDRTDK